jgi:hypothetical protein
MRQGRVLQLRIASNNFQKENTHWDPPFSEILGNLIIQERIAHMPIRKPGLELSSHS